MEKLRAKFYGLQDRVAAFAETWSEKMQRIEANSNADRSAQFTQTRSNLYKLMTAVIIAAMLFFFFSRSLLPYVGSEKNTKPGISIALETDNILTLVSWKYNQKTSEMEVVFDNADLKNAYQSKYNVSVLERRGLPGMEPVISVKNGRVIVVHIRHVPEDFRAIRVDLTLQGEEENSNPFVQNTKTAQFYTNYKTVSYDNKMEEKPEKEYLIDGVNREMKSAEKELSAIRKEIKKTKNSNRKKENEIKLIEQDQVFQTALEIQKSDEDISRKAGEIETNTAHIESLEEEIIEWDDKLEKLGYRLEFLKTGKQPVVEKPDADEGDGTDAPDETDTSAQEKPVQ